MLFPYDVFKDASHPCKVSDSVSADGVAEGALPDALSEYSSRRNTLHPAILSMMSLQKSGMRQYPAFQL